MWIQKWAPHANVHFRYRNESVPLALSIRKVAELAALFITIHHTRQPKMSLYSANEFPLSMD